MKTARERAAKEILDPRWEMREHDAAEVIREQQLAFGRRLLEVLRAQPDGLSSYLFDALGSEPALARLVDED